MTPIRPSRLGLNESHDNLAAVRGERVPVNFSFQPTWRCLVRGIRTHDGFAQELYGQLPEFTRALNARAIMSNRVPDMNSPEDFPYCYTSLYLELDLLPEVAIVEEARDNLASGKAIYETRLGGTVWMTIITVYTYPYVWEPISTATYVCGLCSIKPYRWGIRTVLFCRALCLILPRTGASMLRLLCELLSADLPTVDKNLLILMVAWLGNIDRYVRLRRLTMIDGEMPYVIRGIYYYPFFAK
ncbi:uncharacterized protein N7482_002372 [Penicillium canariense]|uniref:Uncharacterized protein n=1 Tax=Penicillium canariense TaxID=189055 RepID=A0A9W9LUE8_9EURO|nr:uncharacterized protein N7482_002372 [Penicillium canariense]KAJ5176495.1 hypothetical protein N7482_002372 [Penicillium canariense]